MNLVFHPRKTVLVDRFLLCLRNLREFQGTINYFRGSSGTAGLKQDFGRRLTFWGGGCDTRDILSKGTPQQVRDEVRRLKDVFGPQFVVSPSHEALLPNVSPENVLAMAEAAVE